MGIIILAYFWGSIRAKHIGMYKTLYMHKGILTSFRQSLGQLEAFIFFLGHALKEEGWARGWTGIKYQDVSLLFLTTYLRYCKMCFCFQPYNECFDIFHLQSENGN